jgi:hypothetical protein
VKFCRDLQTQRGRQQPTCTPSTEKHEAMNGTEDMARNPRIKGDAVTPNKGRRPETRNVTMGDIL